LFAAELLILTCCLHPITRAGRYFTDKWISILRSGVSAETMTTFAQKNEDGLREY
jgi:hypothetical protein